MMARRPRAPKGPKQVGTLNHPENRLNIPTAEMADLAAMQEERDPLAPAVYPRARPLAEGDVRERDEDLDPQIVWNGARIRLTKDQVARLAETGEVEIGDAQLVWRGKDRQDWSDLIVTAPPLYIQEKVHPKAIIDDLVRQSKAAREEASDAPDLFADFNGLTDPMARTEFYQHDQHWSNRMILGDSLQVMASLAEREALKGKVQAIYFDPPYGIKFNSNWQVSTLRRCWNMRPRGNCQHRSRPLSIPLLIPIRCGASRRSPAKKNCGWRWISHGTSGVCSCTPRSATW